MSSRNGPQDSAMKRLPPALLLAIPFVVGLVPHATETSPPIEVTLSRFAFAPERIEVPLGERVRLSVVSIDGTHGFQIKALGLNARIPAGGKSTIVDLTPKEAGTFEITCSEYCGSGHRRMRASLVVRPDR
jgi:cytochrome c oxidase subunit II